MKPKHYNMNILDKYKDYMDKGVYDKYTWIVFFIQTIVDMTGTNDIIGHFNIEQDRLNKLPIDKQVAVVIESIKQTFITVVSKMMTIYSISYPLLREADVPGEDAMFIQWQLMGICLKRSLTTSDSDMPDYIRTVIHDEFKKNLYDADNLALPVEFNKIVMMMYSTKQIFSNKNDVDHIKNNVDDIMTTLAETMKRKNREITRRYSN